VIRLVIRAGISASSTDQRAGEYGVQVQQPAGGLAEHGAAHFAPVDAGG
jgi:hypothetical protein